MPQTQSWKQQRQASITEQEQFHIVQRNSTNTFRRSLVSRL